MRLSYFIQSSAKTDKTLLPPPLSFSTHYAENFTPLMIPKKTLWKNNDSFLLKNFETGNKVSTAYVLTKTFFDDHICCPPWDVQELLLPLSGSPRQIHNVTWNPAYPSSLMAKDPRSSIDA